MDTEQLLTNVQKSLTRTMIERSLPSGGLPIAFRALLLSLGDRTIKQGDPFKTVMGFPIVGDTISKYYVAGDRPLGNDLASMSAEPFPLITSHTGTDATMEKIQKLTSFKDKMTGSTTGLRYMIVQFTKLGAEYMKYMEYFPKTYSITNNSLVPINIKSHIPAELFKTTVFRTLGKGANMYPLNPSEVFYTMYQLLEEGYDIPVSQLRHFRGFDLGNKLNTIYMKPESLASLFDIGISTFVERVSVTIDIENGRVLFHSHPSKYYGETFVNNVQKQVKRSNYVIGHIYFDPERPPISEVSSGILLEYSNVRFATDDIQQLQLEIEAALSNELFVEYHHYAQQSEVGIVDNIEVDLKIVSKSVRESMIDAIENFREIKRLQYQSEIDKIEEELKENIIKEKVTRPYLSRKIQSLLLEPNDVRIYGLKEFVDEKHKEDPDLYPDITVAEIRDYVWVSNSNDILANLNNSGHERYKALIERQLKEIERLKEKLKEENITEEIKQVYYSLSTIKDFYRKSPVEFLNDSLDIESRELLLEATDLLGQAQGVLPHKVHYFPNYPLSTTLGENLPKDFRPLYTVRTPWIAYQSDGYIDGIKAEYLPDITSENLYFNTNPSQFVAPLGRHGLYLTNQGYIGIWYKPDAEGYNSLELLPNDYVIDFIDITDMVDWETKKVIADKKVVIVKNLGVSVVDLQRLLDIHFDRGNLMYVPNKAYIEVSALEVVDSESELSNMYIFSYDLKTYISLSYLKEEKPPLREKYYLNYIISGYKKAYLDGIHIPISVLNHIVGTSLKEGVHPIDYEYPEGIDKYITILKDRLEDNEERDINQLQSKMMDVVNNCKQTGELGDKYFFKLYPYTFVRELRGRER